MATELFPGKHLFIDDHRIEELTAAKRVLNRPRKHPDNPVLRGEKPWEQQGLHRVGDPAAGRICVCGGRRIHGRHADNPPAPLEGEGS